MDWHSRRLSAILEHALLEDRATSDATSRACIDAQQRATATILAKQDCVLAGVGAVARILEIYEHLDHNVIGHPEVISHGEIFDGVRLHKGQAIAVVRRLALGRLEQADRRIAVTVMPRLARLNPGTVRALGALAHQRGTDVRLSPQRTLTLPDLDPSTVEATEGRLRSLGLIDDPGSGWHGLSACSGLGACARALHDVRAEAERRARERGADDAPEHWAACERRCGCPPRAHIAYTATQAGMEVTEP